MKENEKRSDAIEKPDNGMTRLSRRIKIGYSMGQAGINMMAQIISFYLLYFLTDVYGISAAAAATLLLVPKLWDAVNDPIMGYIADHTQTRWGRYRPYLLFMALPLGLSRVLLFTTPDLGDTGKLIYAYVVYIISGMAFTAVVIPQWALLPTMTQDFKERSNVAGYKVVIGMVAVLLIAIAVKPMVGMFGDEKTGFQMTAAVFSVLAVVMLWWDFAVTEERIRHKDREKYSIKSMFRIIGSNMPLVMLTISNTFSIMVKLVVITAAIYYSKYNMGNEKLYPLFTAVLMISLIIASAVTPAVANRVGKTRTYIWSNLFTITGCLLLYHASYDNTALILVSCCFAGVGVAPSFVLIWTMAADTVEYGEWKTGVRAEGLTYSLIGFSQKFAAGLSGAISGWMLSLTGYVPNVVQTPAALNGILWQMTVVPVIFASLSMLFIYFYNIDQDTYYEILEALDN